MNDLPLKQDNKKSSKLNIILNVLIIILVAVVLFQTTFYSRYSRVYVVGSSMSPTLIGATSYNQSGGDFVYIDRTATPERFDIVVIQTEDKVIIKRVIAFGGETVELRQGVLFINGKEQPESYLNSANNTPSKDVNTFSAKVVEEGCVFVMGDNRNDSLDSRAKYGDINTDEIIGVVTEWSITYKDFLTSLNTFFDFTIKGR
jgi:signal peptidase I